MPARHDQQATAQTRLARARVIRGVTQADLAEALGLSLATYRKLELGEMPNPPLRYLVNAGIALDVPWEALVEDEWREWARLSARRPRPPKREGLWHTAPWSETGREQERRIEDEIARTPWEKRPSTRRRARRRP